MEINCPYRVPVGSGETAHCKLAANLADIPDDWTTVHVQGCIVCQQEPPPETPNRVVASAILTTALRFLPDRYPSLLQKFRPYVRTIQLKKSVGIVTASPQLVEIQNGPGTELHMMLGRLGFRITENCDCRSHIVEMNQQGAEWCRRNLERIVGWLRKEAQRRGIPFVAPMARLLIKRAIRKAEKKQAAE